MEITKEQQEALVALVKPLTRNAYDKAYLNGLNDCLGALDIETITIRDEEENE